jgi:hypothetical protein
MLMAKQQVNTKILNYYYNVFSDSTSKRPPPVYEEKEKVMQTPFEVNRKTLYTNKHFTFIQFYNKSLFLYFRCDFLFVC